MVCGKTDVAEQEGAVIELEEPVIVALELLETMELNELERAWFDSFVSGDEWERTGVDDGWSGGYCYIDVFGHIYIILNLVRTRNFQ